MGFGGMPLQKSRRTSQVVSPKGLELQENPAKRERRSVRIIPKRLAEVALYVIGIFFMGILTGALSGASVSPVVCVLLPLLFTMLAAGGNFVVIWGNRNEDNRINKLARNQRANFLGLQFLSFSIGFLAGLWIGVYAKYNAETVWRTDYRPAYSALPAHDPDTLKLLRDIDAILTIDRVRYDDRQRILESLHAKLVSAEVLSAMPAPSGMPTTASPTPTPAITKFDSRVTSQTMTTVAPTPQTTATFAPTPQTIATVSPPPMAANALPKDESVIMSPKSNWNGGPSFPKRSNPVCGPP